jgi:signal transduction histidine kinase
MEAYIKEKENSSSKDIMIASCSHEIRNFLHVLSAFLELASNNDAVGNHKDHIKNAIYAKDNLSYIIHDLLDYSLIKKGLMELSITSVNLNELVGGISAMFTEQCKMKGVQFILKIDQDLPCCINSDRVRLSQIIINLLSNSIKFTVKGYISLEILPSKFNSIKIVVSDTGIGIKKECKDKLFNAFTKIKQEDTTMNPYGIGLGLMISQKLALLLGSGIVINSDELAGSSFIATINTGLTLREYQDALKIKDLSEFESTIECSNNEKSYLRLPIQKTSLSLMSECTTGVSSKMVVVFCLFSHTQRRANAKA